MAEVNPPWVLQASSHPADVFRRQTQFVAQGQQGVRNWVSGDLAVTANGTPNMSVNVAAGQCLISGTQNTTSQGSATCLNDATVNRTIAASDPTNPRIDIVCASVQDAAYSGSNNQWLIQVITGTPAPSPSAPATPANSIVLAQVAVAANATSITSGNITDKRPVFGQRFRARARNTSSTSVGTSATKIALQSLDYDPSANFDNVTNYNYTVPVPGYYLIAAKAIFFSIADGVGCQAFIYRNGAFLDGGDASSGAIDSPAVLVVGIYNLALNDTIDLRGQVSTGTAPSWGSTTQFSALTIEYRGG